jgi:hypothetical protein
VTIKRHSHRIERELRHNHVSAAMAARYPLNVKAEWTKQAAWARGV